METISISAGAKADALLESANCAIVTTDVQLGNATIPLINAYPGSGQTWEGQFDGGIHGFGSSCWPSQPGITTTGWYVHSQTDYNIFYGPKQVIVEVEIAGCDKKNILASLNGRDLTIDYTRRVPTYQRGKYNHVTGLYTTGRHTINLPFAVSAKRIEAAYKDGLLVFIFQREDVAKIEIK